LGVLTGGVGAWSLAVVVLVNDGSRSDGLEGMSWISFLYLGYWISDLFLSFLCEVR